MSGVWGKARRLAGSSKAQIALISLFLFILGTAQQYLVVIKASSDVAAAYFVIQTFLIATVAVAASTVAVKNYGQIRGEDRQLDPLLVGYPFVVASGLAVLMGIYFLLVLKVSAWVPLLFLASAVLQSTTGMLSLLRLIDRAFLEAQYLRFAVLSLKVGLLLVPVFTPFSLVSLLCLFAIADLAGFLGTMMILLRHHGHFTKPSVVEWSRLGALSWGSINATLRNFPRMFVFAIGERYYSSQALIDLRLFLLPRENLTRIMGIVNIVFFREILERNKLLVGGLIFAVSFLFQLGFVIVLNLTELSLPVSFELILFYLSSSAVYSVIRRQWGLILSDREHTQLLISLVCAAALLALFGLGRWTGFEVGLLYYITLFNAVWVALVVMAGRRAEKQDAERLPESGPDAERSHS